MVSIMVFLVSSIFICSVLWYASRTFIRKLDERFMFLSRKPRKFEYKRNLKGTRYLVMNGCSAVGRAALQNLADRGASLHLIHSPKEEIIYNDLAVNLRKNAKKCTIVLERCDILLWKSIDELSETLSESAIKFSSFLYFPTEGASIDSDLGDMSYCFLKLNLALDLEFNKPSPRVVFAAEFGGHPYRRDETYDAVFTELEDWQDHEAYHSCPLPAPKVAFANTGCIWNDSRFSFAYTLHWLGHKMKARMPCHQGENSVIHALLSKEKESKADGVYFVNDSEWCTAPHFERVDSKGKKIVDFQLRVTPELEEYRGKPREVYFEYCKKKSREKKIARRKELGLPDWFDYETEDADPKGSVKGVHQPEDILSVAATNSSKDSKPSLVEITTIDEKDSSKSAPSQSLAVSSGQLEALASSITRIEKTLLEMNFKPELEVISSSITRLEKNLDKIMMVLDAICSLMTRTETDHVSLPDQEKNSEGDGQNIVLSQELADHSETPENVSSQEIDQ
ncbi:hypothetical protein PUMCH_002506 [Australozyma saopauloensis]|uniref:Uncharacterized protein n=1 Tax=Australozyma saopauloensis TaxID=291208 RepID=A0AAX4H9J6_9ASCO|nr:hypothetical protein PUMCH_002506 [[Candida] saopauloensis]